MRKLTGDEVKLIVSALLTSASVDADTCHGFTGADIPEMQERASIKRALADLLQVCKVSVEVQL